MALHVQVLHPSYARFMPRGGRVLRDGFFPLRTPVALCEMHRDEFEPLAMLRQRHDPVFGEKHSPDLRPILLARGGLWTPLFERGRPLQTESLVRFLEGREHPAGEDGEPQRFFHGTPLNAAWNGYRGTRGEGDLNRSREIVHDGSARATADLLRFMEGHVATCEGQAMVRLTNVMACHEAGRGDAPARLALEILRTGYLYHSRHADPADYRHLAAKLARDEPYCMERGLILPGGEGLEAYYGLECDRPFPFEMTRGAEVRSFANGGHLAAMRLSVIMEAIDNATRDGTMPDDVGRAVARSRHWRAVGAVGSVREDEVPECLFDLRTVIRELRDAFPRPANSHGLKRLSLQLERDIIPRMTGVTAVPDQAPEDEEALDGLGWTP